VTFYAGGAKWGRAGLASARGAVPPVGRQSAATIRGKVYRGTGE
jgi:hypothetical protein